MFIIKQKLSSEWMVVDLLAVCICLWRTLVITGRFQKSVYQQSFTVNSYVNLCFISVKKFCFRHCANVWLEFSYSLRRRDDGQWLRHGRGSIFCNPTQPMTLQTQSTTCVVTRESWPNPIQPNIEQQHNIVQIGYINQKPISK